MEFPRYMSDTCYEINLLGSTVVVNCSSCDAAEASSFFALIHLYFYSTYTLITHP
jgi:hypothetical protein